MKVRVLIGAFLSAIIVMGVGTAFWMVPLPKINQSLGASMIQAVPNEDVVLTTLQQQLPEDGAYVLPFMPVDKNDPAYKKKEEAGPLVHIFFHKAGLPFGEPVQMAVGFVHYFLSALILGCLLGVARISSYGRRLLVMILAGIFASFSVELLNPLWWHHPWKFHLLTALHQVVGWLFAGFIFAALTKPAQRPKAEAVAEVASGSTSPITASL